MEAVLFLIVEGIHNPGVMPNIKDKTGKDKEVIEFLKQNRILMYL